MDAFIADELNTIRQSCMYPKVEVIDEPSFMYDAAKKINGFEKILLALPKFLKEIAE